MDFSFNVSVFSVFTTVFPLNDFGETFNEVIDEINFSLANSVSVRYIPGTATGGGVNTIASSGLELHLVEELLEVRSSGDKGDLNHGTSS